MERSFLFPLLPRVGSRLKASSMPATQMLEGTIWFSYAFEHTLNLILEQNKNECSVLRMHLLSLSFHTRWLCIMLKLNVQYATGSAESDLAFFSCVSTKYDIY